MRLFVVLAMLLSACAQVQTRPRVSLQQKKVQYEPYGTPSGSNQRELCPMADPASLPEGKIYGSFTPFVGGFVTYVKNNTNFWFSRIRVNGQELVLYDACRPEPEVGLGPNKEVYFSYCPCGRNPRTGRCMAVLDGDSVNDICRIKVEVDYVPYRKDLYSGEYYEPDPDFTPSHGCVGQRVNPNTTSAEANMVVVLSQHLNRKSCH